MTDVSSGFWLRTVGALACAVLVAAVGAPSAAGAGASRPDQLDDYGEQKARLFWLNDAGADVDNSQTLVRLLLYSNEIDIEGIVSTTSQFRRTLDEQSSKMPQRIFNAYEQVRSNLVKHDRQYPTADYFRSIFAEGQYSFGMTAVGEDKPVSSGAKRLIAAVDRPDPRPLWVGIGGGPNTLAQALSHVRATRTPAQLEAFVSKLRAYSIFDQDDSGAWIRKEFPDLSYVVSYSTWMGMGGGGGSPMTSHAWEAAHYRSKGTYGSVYRLHYFGHEGDTPTWLWLAHNGLAGATNPSWGGWGGRYVLTPVTVQSGRPINPAGDETRPSWTEGPGSADTSSESDAPSDSASVARWAEAYQQDFSNRMDWTLGGNTPVNHNPQVVVNGMSGRAPVVISVRPRTAVTLDATGSTDPDGNGLTYQWLWYREAGTRVEDGRAGKVASPEVTLSATTGQSVTVTPMGAGQAHIVLTATDDGGSAVGEPFPGRAYRRIIIDSREGAGQAPQVSTTLPPSPALPTSSCTKPRLALRLARRPSRGTITRPVVRRGRSYRYRARLTCRVGSRRTPAPRGTKLRFEVPFRRRARTVTLGRNGVVHVRIAVRRSGKLVVRYTPAGGGSTFKHIVVRVVRGRS